METQVNDARQVLRSATGAHRTELQEIVDLVATICDCEFAAIAILDDDLSHLTITHGLEPMQCPSVFHASPHLGGPAMALRFYASAPFHAPDGQLLGRLCVFDPRPRKLNALQQRALEVLAAGVTDVMRLHLTSVLPANPAEATLSAEEEIARIAAEISHDMRAPLATIMGNVEVLQERLDAWGPDGTIVAMLERTERAGQRLMTMVEQLLAFHRAGSNEVWESVDLDRLTRQLVLDLEEELERADAKVEVDALPNVSGNRYQLGTVLLNLITNAIKFAKPDVPLVLHIGAEDRGGRQRIRVVDNGIGVAPHAHEHVFRMFGRANGRVEGHGIGLATASRIVRAHGGDMGMVSDGSSGTEVWLELNSMPVVPAQRS